MAFLDLIELLSTCIHLTTLGNNELIISHNRRLNEGIESLDVIEKVIGDPRSMASEAGKNINSYGHHITIIIQM